MYTLRLHIYSWWPKVCHNCDCGSMCRASMLSRQWQSNLSI